MHVSLNLLQPILLFLSEMNGSNIVQVVYVTQLAIWQNDGIMHASACRACTSTCLGFQPIQFVETGVLEWLNLCSRHVRCGPQYVNAHLYLLLLHLFTYRDMFEPLLLQCSALFFTD